MTVISPEFYVARNALAEVAPSLTAAIREVPNKRHPGLHLPTRMIAREVLTQEENLTIDQAFLLGHKVHDPHAHRTHDSFGDWAICCRCATIPTHPDPDARSWCWHH